ncbi:cytochrome c maturation protein CcmE [Nitrosococcus oceani]|uniref:Cytochrome c-type biogenesis protein CcmE n=2 Tax=Nitrosococcus oceani TaxID=1229 RepID=CCME_NITOC|nr:cytochrome c maturation protein CcmE [Nitrosococcus oceani]Q3JCJ0.1 RecName: Full=Cytochrome c-type biogenesis protein CcmE; AltName: Full=Cytochrome c maturation protein E; AltName: Full=Heme chaperone CcmE [Nitrosococcus oceani ATCC 19707]KFI20149.1 cytochrome C biogenesis protein CcmE [Nitrosococcus oceani C-27]ABA57456.1 Cytochrome c-type biogenesis protein CcmE [Nitrosococcus oceani ATCC 19707]KFI23261.1 cytochrome C biogenesis protein CcmE [Nitrosococcus oceani]GEM21421.1 cytochrome c
MTVRQRRFAMVILVVIGVSIATGLGLKAFQENILFFYNPTQIMAGEVPTDTSIRVGGVVVNGSVKRESGNLDVQFDLTDMAQTVTVVYSGLLPDLFREGQGIVAMGKLGPNKVFEASEVLAKHDEEYMPPEVADSLAKTKANTEDKL